MTGPRDRERHVPTCLCGHNQQRHLVAGFDGECIAEGCGCPGFDARVPLAPLPTTPSPIAGPNRLSTPAAPSMERLVLLGKRSQVKRTAALAERIQAYSSELFTRLCAEQQAERAAAVLSRARTTLAAPLPSVPPLPADRPRTCVAEPTVCEDCGQTFRSGHAKGAHRRHKHPKAQAS